MSVALRFGRSAKLAWPLLLAGWLCAAQVQAEADNSAVVCADATGEPQLLWGDLHVHTAYSLDAYAFGALATPKEAYAFARGQPLRLDDGEVVTIDRPLDFTAVTDHAATYDVMYVCTDPLYKDNAYCRAIREGTKARDARSVFNNYLLPLVSDVPPQAASMCAEKDVDCVAASASQWRRTQFAANNANEPCKFTALIGYEWTASPGGRHWHRNVIFKSDKVPEQVVDYVNFPQVTSLWRELDKHCLPAQGCDVITIPHNINWADGGPTFDVENASEAHLKARARYERLAEIHQEKGNSECLPPQPDGAADTGAEDCSFERVTENAAKHRLSGEENISKEEAWQRMRASYYRTLLGRGLAGYERSGGKLNPLMLGAIGSTDNHFGLAGQVSEDGYTGGVWGLWRSAEERLSRPGYNPGGLVAVWASENTRAAVFEALQQRRAYATSGPRISLQFSAGAVDGCGVARPDPAHSSLRQAEMGGTLDTTAAQGAPYFTVLAGRDQIPLSKVQIIKGEVKDGQVSEQTVSVAEYEEGRDTVCVSWQDPAFSVDIPAYWYARVLEQPSSRWTQILCQRAGLCDRFADGNTTVSERAWSSPIWNLP